MQRKHIRGAVIRRMDHLAAHEPRRRRYTTFGESIRQEAPEAPLPLDVADHKTRATGLEPATSGSTVRCSNQLSYAPGVFDTGQSILANQTKSLGFAGALSTNRRESKSVALEAFLSGVLKLSQEVLNLITQRL